MFQVSTYLLLASVLVLSSICIQPSESRPSSIDDDDDNDDYDSGKQHQKDITQRDLINHGMNIDESKAVPVLIEIPDTEATSSSDDIEPHSSSSYEAAELSLAESAPKAHYNHQQQQRRPVDLKASASHYKHHKHGAKGWLDMGAWTSKKGAFGWHDKHPVGKGK